MTKRKYEKGKRVESIKELDSMYFIYIGNKIWHPAWWTSLQYGYLERQIEAGNVWIATRIGG